MPPSLPSVGDANAAADNNDDDNVYIDASDDFIVVPVRFLGIVELTIASVPQGPITQNVITWFKTTPASAELSSMRDSRNLYSKAMDSEVLAA